MMQRNKQPFFLLGAAIIILFLFFALLFLSFFQTGKSKSGDNSLPTPTPVPYTRDSQGKFIFTPLAKTTIGTTTVKDIEENQPILSKSTANGITTYTIPSATSGKTDEIRTQFGTVIFESTNTFNLAKGTPPKTTVYTKEFGQPEKVIDEVSTDGKFISAYIYAKQGFTLFANRYTGTVHVVQRFLPMSTAEYEKIYSSYLQKAPEYPKESFTQ